MTSKSSQGSHVGVHGIDVDCMTLTRYVLSEQKKVPKATGELSQLLAGIQTAVKTISTAVRRAGITELFGAEGSSNVQGEDQKKLDIVSNELFINVLRNTYTVAFMVSEENEEIIEVEDAKKGSYIVYFDPLDGSSNIDCLVSIGTIFCIMKKKGPEPPKREDVLQSGLNIVASGYALYGSATMLVLGLGNSVQGFMLDPTIGEFILTEVNMKIPSKGKIYSINEGHSASWDKAVTEYIDSKKNPKDGSQPYNARYVGSMVADVHRTIKYGGIFLYPVTKKAPKGKLRLLYECFPMAHLVTLAGGLAWGANGPLLETIPEGIHDRSPIVLGSQKDVEDYLQFVENQRTGK